MPQSDNSLKKFLLQTSVIGLCLGLIILYFAQHQEEFLLIKKFTTIDILLLLGLLMINNTIHSYRTLIILRNIGLNTISFWEWLKIVTISRFINHYMAQGANLYRIVKLKKDYNFSYTQSISMTFFFTWLDINFLLLIALICMLLLPASSSSYTYTFCGIATTLGFSFFSPFFLKLFLKQIPPRFKLIAWLKARINILTKIFFTEIKKISSLIKYFFFTSLFFIFLAIIINICFFSLGFYLNPAELFLFTLIFILSRTINIVPGNLGLAEILCGYFSEFLGATLGSGIIISSMIRVLNFILLSSLTLFIKNYRFSR